MWEEILIRLWKLLHYTYLFQINIYLMSSFSSWFRHCFFPSREQVLCSIWWLASCCGLKDLLMAETLSKCVVELFHSRIQNWRIFSVSANGSKLIVDFEISRFPDRLIVAILRSYMILVVLRSLWSSLSTICSSTGRLKLLKDFSCLNWAVERVYFAVPTREACGQATLVSALDS